MPVEHYLVQFQFYQNSQDNIYYFILFFTFILTLCPSSSSHGFNLFDLACCDFSLPIFDLHIAQL